MNTEIRHAFAPLDARAGATPARAALDRISVRDHVVAADIGAFETERGVSQRLRFNVVAEVLAATAGAQDDVDRILSYDEITGAIAEALEAERVCLLETLAERVAGLVLRHGQVARVFVRVEKLDRGPGALGVEIVRTAVEDEPDIAPGNVPLVVCFPEGVLSAVDVATQVADLHRPDRPLVVCPAPMADRPRCRHAASQNRVDLLSMEQAAWVLAETLPGSTVVASRTELDWATGQGLIAVLAPSRQVLAATGEVPAANDPIGLAAWVAARIGAGAPLILDAPAATAK